MQIGDSKPFPVSIELGKLEMLGGEHYKSRKSWRKKDGGWGSTEGKLCLDQPHFSCTSTSLSHLHWVWAQYVSVASVIHIVSPYLTKFLLRLKVLASPSFWEFCLLGFCDIIPFGSFLLTIPSWVSFLNSFQPTLKSLGSFHSEQSLPSYHFNYHHNM